MTLTFQLHGRQREAIERRPLRVTLREKYMKKTKVTVPELMLLAGTRVALGAGFALLMAESLAPRQRKVLGWSLFMLGAATTVPLARDLLHKLE